MSSPRLLAIDTSSDLLCLGLAAGDRRWTHEEAGGALASAALLPRVLAMLDEAGLSVRDLEAIAFGRGPGAFTGLRTACSVAQGLALGTGVPLVPVDTLAVVAESVREQWAVRDVWVAQDARMGEVYAACYRWSGERWVTRVPPALYDPQALQVRMREEPADAVGGSALALHPGLASACPEAHPGARPAAPALLRLALGGWRRGETVDAAAALPLYLRDKVALTTAEREAMREAGP
ncbi:tRNA (adenosine(37)-N6)-threonylcarbamoyltransferase complex dimerization subunit type 1 TsaB [Schlegelella aquatica]|uniref:tRNA (adenosine(37)-N6)-threonylcarbamoyltransferase complex dimerization subunit type 1 TsaB n=1 Tax=Caldimonas aquatica TaxID=376175 RepID=UPI003753A05A